MIVLVKSQEVNAVDRSAGSTRDRMIDAALEQLQERGVDGMSFTEVLHRSGAARGAIYHHFPGGKAELVATAVRRHAAQVASAIAALPAESPAGVVRAFLEAVRPVVGHARAGHSCALAATAVGADGLDPSLRAVAGAGLRSWTDALAARLREAGLTAERSTAISSLLVALLEGGQVLARAEDDTAAFEAAAGWVLDTLDAASR